MLAVYMRQDSNARATIFQPKIHVMPMRCASILASLRAMAG